MREPTFYTRSVLTRLVPRYCFGRLVDVGAGKSKYRPMIERSVSEYIPVDDLSSQYQYDRDSAKKSVQYVSDASALPFQDKEFDSALCTEVIEHVQDPQAVVNEIYRVLRPGGHLILASGWLAPYHAEPKDYWRFSVEGYQVLGARAGFSFIHQEKQGGLFSSLYFIVSRNVELRGGRAVLILWRKLWRIRRLMELLAEKMDTLFPTPDAMGHVVVLKKE